MTASVITIYQAVAYCHDCDWKSVTVNTAEAATRLATDHNTLHHDDGAAA